MNLTSRSFFPANSPTSSASGSRDEFLTTQFIFMGEIPASRAAFIPAKTSHFSSSCDLPVFFQD